MPPVESLNLAADIVDLTMALVDVPSESFHDGPLADAVESALRALPLALTVSRIGDTVVARTELGRPERVVLAGHLDTVPAAAGNGVASLVAPGEPVPVVGPDGVAVAEEECVYGLGSVDMKGGLAVLLSAAAQVPAPGRDVTFVAYACEEVAAVHNGLAQVVAQRPELLSDADFAILLEPSDAGVEAGCQGTMRVEVTVRGRRAHSARSWLGENAVHAAGEILDRLRDYRPAQVDVDGLTYREGMSAVGISGGVAGNVIPDECTVTVNYRFAPVRSVPDAEAHLREVFAGFDVVVTDAAPGALPGLESPAVAAFLRASGAQARPKFGWTDVARFTELGMPAVNFGPGDPSLAHTPEEHVPVRQLRAVQRGLFDWLNEGVS